MTSPYLWLQKPARTSRINEAIEKAEDAFWASIAESFPEVKTGDDAGLNAHAWNEANQTIVRDWLSWNHQELSRELLFDSTFNFDDHEMLWEGYYDPQVYWNGWSVPWMTREQLDKFMADQNRKDEEGVSVTGFEWYWDGDEVVVIDVFGGQVPGPEDEYARIAPFERQTVHGMKTLWELNIGWIFDRLTRWQEE